LLHTLCTFTVGIYWNWPMSCLCIVLTQAKHGDIYIYNHLFSGFQGVTWQFWYCLGIDNLKLGRHLIFSAVTLYLWQQDAWPMGVPLQVCNPWFALKQYCCLLTSSHRNAAGWSTIYCLPVGIRFLLSTIFWNRVIFSFVPSCSSILCDAVELLPSHEHPLSTEFIFPFLLFLFTVSVS
jgi:hypothetical protein